MHRALGLGEQREDCERPLAHGGFDAGGLQPRAHIRQPHVAVRVVFGGRHLEAHTGQRCVPVRVDGDLHRRWRLERSERTPQSVCQVRPRIQHRRSEHIAGDAAHRIEVKAPEAGGSGRARRHVRIRVRRCGGRCVVHATATLP